MITQNVANVAITDEELALILARRNGNAVAEVESPQPLSMGLNSRVLYTSNGGRTAEYRIGWIGPDNKRPGVTRVGLRKGRTGKMFFVDAEKCKLA